MLVKGRTAIEGLSGKRQAAGRFAAGPDKGRHSAYVFLQCAHRLMATADSGT